MRVIAGQYGGRSLKTPKGSGTRPTTDRVKESLMSSLDSILGGFSGLSVLDAFAGSGGLGIEALSRGAQTCQFFDKDRQAIQTIRSNLEMLNIPSTRARVRQADVFSAKIFAPRPFDLVFLDPPYAIEDTHVVDFVIALASAGMLAPFAVVVYEHDSSKSLDEALAKGTAQGIDLRIVKSKRQGACALDIIELRSSSEKG